MGMISIYTYSSYILHILSTQSTQTNHIRRLPCSLPFPIFIASQYISCRFLAGVPFPRSRILFSPRPIRFRPSRSVFRNASVAELSFLSVSRLVGASRHAGRVVVPRPVVSVREACRRSVPRLVHAGSSERCAVFVSSFSRVVIVSPWCSFPGGGVSSVPLFVSLWRCGFAVRSSSRSSARRGVSGFFASRRSSREASCEASRFLTRLFSSCSPCRSLFLVRHRSSDEGVPASFRRRHRAECLVKATKSVACFLFYPHPRRFPQLRFPSWRGRGRCP